MSNEKENGEVLETTEEQDVEGYDWCGTAKQNCMSDCLGGGPALSQLIKIL